MPTNSMLMCPVRQYLARHSVVCDKINHFGCSRPSSRWQIRELSVRLSLFAGTWESYSVVTDRCKCLTSVSTSSIVHDQAEMPEVIEQSRTFKHIRKALRVFEASNLLTRNLTTSFLGFSRVVVSVTFR